MDDCKCVCIRVLLFLFLCVCLERNECGAMKGMIQGIMK